MGRRERGEGEEEGSGRSSGWSARTSAPPLYLATSAPSCRSSYRMMRRRPSRPCSPKSMPARSNWALTGTDVNVFHWFHSTITPQFGLANGWDVFTPPDLLASFSYIPMAQSRDSIRIPSNKRCISNSSTVRSTLRLPPLPPLHLHTPYYHPPKATV